MSNPLLTDVELDLSNNEVYYFIFKLLTTRLKYNLPDTQYAPLQTSL